MGASTPALDTITSVGRLKVSGGGSTVDLAAAIQPAVDALTERGDSPADTDPVRVFSPKNEPVLVVNVAGDYQYPGCLGINAGECGGPRRNAHA